MAPNYPVWQIFVKKFGHFFRITEIPARGGLSYGADGKLAFNLVNTCSTAKLKCEVKILAFLT